MILRQEDLGGQKNAVVVILGRVGLLAQFQGAYQIIEIVHSEFTNLGVFYYHICNPQSLVQYNTEN